MIARSRLGVLTGGTLASVPCRLEGSRHTRWSSASLEARARIVRRSPLAADIALGVLRSAQRRAVAPIGCSSHRGAL